MHKELAASLDKLNIQLSIETQHREIVFLEELLRWNRQINLTSVRDHHEALEKHLIDSLALLAFLPVTANLLDMGSGGGLPGIPLALACPGLQVVSVDSVGKKINFQNHIKRSMHLANLQPIQARLEQLESRLPTGQQFDLVVARAFSSIEQMLLLAAPWLRVDGELMAMKGPEGEDELLQVADRITAYGFRVGGLERYRLPSSRADRQVIRFNRLSRP